MSKLYVNTIAPQSGTDVNLSGSVKITGNLEVTGTLHAKTTEFIVSANSTTFGDAGSDSLTFNASTGSIPNGFNFDSNTLVINSTTNRVGVGVAAPTTTLDVNGTVKATTFTGGSLSTTGDLTIGDDLLLQSDSAILSFGLGDDVSLTHTNDVGIHLNAAMRLGFRDQGGEYVYSVSDGNLAVVAATSIDLKSPQVDIGEDDTSDVTINLLGSTNDMAIVYDESAKKLSFDSTDLVIDGTNSRVGIGTADPGADLEINAEHPKLLIRSNHANGDGQILFKSGDGTQLANIRCDTTSNALNHFVISAGSGTDDLAIDGSGNIGINDTTPSHRLDVNGTLRSTGIATFDANVVVSVDADADDTTADSATGRISAGVGADLNLYHGGTNSYVVNNTGDLIIATEGSGGGIILDTEDDTLEIKYSNVLGATFDGDGLDLVTGDAYQINGASVLNATTLGSAVVASSLTSVGTLTALQVDNININGSTITSDTTATIDAAGDIALSADGGNVTMDDGTITVFDFDVDSPTLTIYDDADTDGDRDYFKVVVGAAGATTISTNDDDGAAANLIITADGTVDIDSAGAMTLDSGGHINLDPATGSHIVLDGTIQVDAGVVTGATSVTVGSTVVTDDSIVMTPSASDTVTIAATANGALTITTVDTADAAANIQITADGTFEVDATTITLDSSGTVVLDAASTAAGAIDINSAGGMDVDVADEINIATTSADGHISLVSAHTAGVALHIDADANAGSIVDIDAGILDIDVTGAASLDSTAGSITVGAILADGQTLKLGKNGAVETIIAPHGTAGSELYSVINTAGDTDGADAAGSILLSSVAGGIGLAWADGKDLWAEGGRAVIVANEDAANAIHLHADAGANQTILLQNDAGTSDGADDGSSSIHLHSGAGGIGITCAATKDLHMDGGQIKMVAIHDVANTIYIRANAGTSETIKIHADQGTGAGSIELTSDVGSVDINAGDNITMDAADDIVVTTTSVDGEIQIVSAHAAGRAVFIDANANAGSIVDIDAGILDIDVTGAATIDAASLTVTSDTVTFTSANANDPIVTIQNTTADADAPRLKFNKNRGADSVDEDDIGKVEFWSYDDGTPTVQQYAGILADIDVVTSGQESGRLTFQVASHDGGLESGIILVGGSADAEVDVTLGNGADSLTTISGDLDIPNGGFALGSDASGDMYFRNSSGVLTRIAVGSDNHVLTLDGAVPGWEAASGGTAADDITIGDAAISLATTVGNITIDAQANDADVIIKVDDAGASITAVTFDGSEAGAATFNSTVTTGDAITATKDTDGEFVALKLVNQSDAANTTGIVSIQFDLEDTAGTAVDAAKIAVKKEASFTATAATQDSSVVFSTSKNGTLNENMTLDSEGYLYIPERLVHAGDTDTFIKFTDNQVNIELGGVNAVKFSSSEITMNESQDDRDFRIESNNETHMFFLDAANNRISIGDSTNPPAATLEVSNHASAGAFDVPLMHLDNNDVNQVALEIVAANTIANVIDIDADSITTHNIIDISADDCLTSGKVLHIDVNDAATTAVTPTYMHFDFDKDGVAGSGVTQSFTGLDIDLSDAATNHASSTVTMIGLDVAVDSASTAGTNTNVGLNIVATDATTNDGVRITAENGAGADIKMFSSANSADFATMSVGVNGETTIATVDGDSNLADLTLSVDGSTFIRNGSVAARGGGFDAAGSSVTSFVSKINGEHETTLLIDIAGLTSDGTNKEIIGDSGGTAAAFITQLTTAVNGLIYRATMACIEAPTTGEVDIDLVANSSNLAQGVVFDSTGTSVQMIAAGGDWALGMYEPSQKNPASGNAMTAGLNNYYLYLAVGTDSSPTAGTYGAGKFVIKLYGSSF